MGKPLNKRSFTVAALAALLLLVIVVPFPFQPPGSARMVLDHTLKVYAAPPCFQQAGLTNYLTETTWSKAKASGYEPESSCTAQLMEPVSTTLLSKMSQLLGLRPSPWSWQ